MDQRRRRRRRRRPRHLAEFVRPGGRAEEADGGSALVQGYAHGPSHGRRGLLATGRSDQPAEATREYSAVPYVVCVTHSVSTVHYVHEVPPSAVHELTRCGRKRMHAVYPTQHGTLPSTVSHSERYPTQHGMPPSMVSHSARYPTQHGIPPSTVSAGTGAYSHA